MEVMLVTVSWSGTSLGYVDNDDDDGCVIVHTQNCERDGFSSYVGAVCYLGSCWELYGNRR
jgi:hypothetical protein